MSKPGRSSLLMLWGFVSLFTQHCPAQQFVPDWIKTFPAGLGVNSRGTSIATAPDGNILICGSIDDEYGEPDYLVIKYNAAGDALWKTTHASATRKNNALADIALDALGNILLTGSSDTVKLDAFGNRIWSAPFSGRSVAVNSRYAYVTALTPPGYATVQLGNDVSAPLDVILDCDPGGDADDMSDLAI